MLAAVTFAGCGSEVLPTEVSPTLTATPGTSSPSTPVPTPSPGAAPRPTPSHPPDVRTGVDGIDVVIDALLDRDVTSTSRLIQPTMAPCTSSLEVGSSPPCRSGEKDGTVVPTIASSDCQGGLVRRDEYDVAALANQWRGLYAVFGLGSSEVPPLPWPQPRYAIVFTRNWADLGVSRSGVVGQVVYLDENFRIVWVDGGCAAPPDKLVEGRQDFLLPPAD